MSLLEQALKRQVGEVRTKQGRNVKTSFCIVDAQSVKNTSCARNKDYDAGKKYRVSSGIFWWIANECHPITDDISNHLSSSPA
jgi:hypothetical protein